MTPLAPSPPSRPRSATSLWLALPLLFGAGLATSLTPCVYPMIPITAGILGGAGATGITRRRAAILTSAYVARTGPGLRACWGCWRGSPVRSSGPWPRAPGPYFLTGNLLLVFGLALLDVFTVNVPQRARGLGGRLGASSPGGAFVMGAASRTGRGAMRRSRVRRGADLRGRVRAARCSASFICSSFSLGLTALLVAVGLSSGAARGDADGAGRWTLWVKRVGGVLLLLMAEYYFVRMGTVL